MNDDPEKARELVAVLVSSLCVTIACSLTHSLTWAFMLFTFTSLCYGYRLGISQWFLCFLIKGFRVLGTLSRADMGNSGCSNLIYFDGT